MKNASDLCMAMEITEQASGETIQDLEMTVAELEPGDHACYSGSS